MKNELQRHKKSDKIKWIAVFAAVILLAVSVTAAITKGFKDFNPYGWFDKKPEQTETLKATVKPNGVRATANTYNSAQTKDVSFYTGAMPAFATPAGSVAVEYGVSTEGMQLYRAYFSFPAVSLDMFIVEKVELVLYSSIAGVSTVYGTMSLSGDKYSLVFDVDSSDLSFILPALAIRLTIGEGVPLPEAPEKEGHTFIGWYYGTGETCGEECVKYESDVITGNIDLHPHYSVNQYTVTFNSAGGEEVTPITFDYNTAPELPTSTRIGHVFLGWYNGDTKYAGEPLKGNTTLTAKWEKKIYTVTFYVDGKVYKTLEVPYGMTLTEVIKKENLALNVKSIAANNGKPIDIANGVLTVTTDLTADADLKSTAQKAVTSWWKLLIGAAVGIGIIALLCCIPSMIKSKKRRKA